MFKKGQLVRSRKYRDLYVVDRAATTEVWCWAKRVFAKRLAPSILFPIERLELIGNNYKAK